MLPLFASNFGQLFFRLRRRYSCLINLALQNSNIVPPAESERLENAGQLARRQKARRFGIYSNQFSNLRLHARSIPRSLNKDANGAQYAG